MANAQIINNERQSAQDGLRIDHPFLYVPYPDKPKPVSGGGLYFGVPGTDPEIPANQKRVYYIEEDGSILPLNQPVPLGNGGVPTYNGSPAKLAVDGSYSYKVIDKVGTAAQSTVYYSAKTAHPALQNIGETIILEEIKTLEGGQTVVEFDTVDLSMATIDITGPLIDSRDLYKDTDYTISDGAAGILFLVSSFPAGTKIRARQNAFTNQEDSPASTYPYVYDAVNDALVEDLPIGAKVIACGRTLAGDGFNYPLYRVVSGGTGTADGIRYINMNNGFQLEAVDIRNKFRTVNERVGAPSVSAGVMTIDALDAPVQIKTLTSNVSSIQFTNAPAGDATTITLRLTQDGTGSRSVNFAGIRFAGGTPPTLSTGAGETDVIVFQNFGGSQWHGFVAGLDMQVV
jgi:hypothetical protein